MIRRYNSRRRFIEGVGDWKLNMNKAYEGIKDVQSRICALDFVYSMKKFYSTFANMCEKLSDLNETVAELQAAIDDMEDEEDSYAVEREISRINSLVNSLNSCLDRLS